MIEFSVNDVWSRRAGYLSAIIVLALLCVSAVMLALAPQLSNGAWLENQVKAVVTLGAPILGMIILARQPRNRVAWLWIVYGLAVGLRALGHAIYFSNGSQPAGYSALENFLLWFTETANIAVQAALTGHRVLTANIAEFGCLILLMLWFPDGKLPSRRWRFLYIWLALSLAAMSPFLFVAGPDWNGGAAAGGIVIDNPYGWLPVPADTPIYSAFFPFLSIVLIMILAALSLVFRYRSAGQLVRLQLRWFVLGSLLLVCLDFLPLFYTTETLRSRIDLLINVIGFSYILPLYLAVGIAITRYHLFDIDVIIRRTLQYSLLTGLLALGYFGSVVLLQSLFSAFGAQSSSVVIVLSTLGIAALFSPLRRRIQDFIDRRFYRRKYDAERALAQFAITARDEVDQESLTAALVGVVHETIQPENASLWLKRRRER